MEWGLFVLAVLLVAALQFAVWRRLQSEDAGTPESGLAESASPADVASSQSNASVLLCPACGAENDADYRFCRECVAQLQP
ncbi:zinc ribbon domain-containing protein [Halobacterium sp. CBA1126]|uniref:zinc ribbon domain-containing protein n=1 Tax=Halobacterium TaxID=2239 RepID=UPI0012F92A32|nr:zinc ribbon domain-containing protein [Halobacterium sp. CBA1126]MUV60685.1 zinc ribbon domain-containing protein [Halobacterium sp. CBA1126]